MSQQLMLVEYPCDDNGRLHEPAKDTILSTFVDSSIVESLLENEIFEKYDLYEDDSYEEHTPITRLKSNKVAFALELITAQLIQLLESERIESIKTIQTESDVSNLMGELQVISSAYQLLKLKRDNFANSDSTVVMLG